MSYAVQTCSLKTYEKACATVAAALKEPVSFLQAPLYGKLQEKSGKSVVYFSITQDTTVVGCGLAVAYQAPGGLQFLYCPYGPVCTTWNADLLAALRAFFRPIAATHGYSFVRLDTDGLKAIAGAKPLAAASARTASLQPRAEWLLDITPSNDELWTAFHKHTRYHVRLAERAGAVITTYSPREAPLDSFYHLMQKTGDRDSFGIFQKSYYASYLQTLSDDQGFMVVVTIDDTPAAAGLFVLHDSQAHYVFAGSSNDFRKIAPAYSVIWTALQEAKKRGCTLFNFGGITDDVKGHDLGGVTSFKKRFGGWRVDHQNPIDLVYKPWKYRLFTLYKTLR